MTPDSLRITNATPKVLRKRRPILWAIRRVFGLSRSQRRLFLKAIPTVAIVRLGLWFFHPSNVMRRVDVVVASRLSDAAKRRPARIGEISWAVRAASRRIPAASCLVQALAARLLFADYGKASELRIGVARKEGGQIDAHAWVEVDGVAVVGGSGISRFSVFPDLESALAVAPGRFKKV